MLDVKKVYHLMGEQTIPIFLSAIQFQPWVHHYLLATKKTEYSANYVVKALQDRQISAEVRLIGAENAAVSFRLLNESISEILDDTNKEEAPSAFNITGGTKPMSFIALLLGNKRPWLAPFYLDSIGRKMLWLKDYSETELEEKIELKDFIALCGMEISNEDISEPSEKLLDLMYQNVTVIQRSQEKFASCIQKNGKKTQNPKDSFQQFLAELSENMSKKHIQSWKPLWNEYTATESSWQQQAKFLAGGWFEHYVGNLIRRHSASPQAVRIGLEISKSGDYETLQEFDVVYTDGFQLVILECKAGQIKQDHIQKLMNLRDFFGGSLGRCALVTLVEADTSNNKRIHLRDRITANKKIAAFCGKAGLQILPSRLFNFSVGTVYPGEKKS